MAGEHEGHRLVSDLSVTEALSILLRGEQEAEHVTRVADRPMLFDDAVHDAIDSRRRGQRAIAARRGDAEYARAVCEVAAHAVE